MTSFTNYTSGPKGFNLKAGGTAWVDPGETIELDEADIAGTKPDLGKAPATDEESAASLSEALALIEQQKVTIANLEAQIAAQPVKRVGLTGKSKDQLIAIAADEGATIEDGATVNDIVSAIELHRETNA